jgi:hypothetical protein
MNGQQQNQITTPDFTADGTPVEPTSLPGIAMFAGIGTVVAVSVVAAT